MDTVCQPKDRCSRFLLTTLDALETVKAGCSISLAAGHLLLVGPWLSLLPRSSVITHQLKSNLYKSTSLALGNCGPTTIKFLQWAATRQDLFPELFCKHAAEFQAQVAPDPFPLMLVPILHALGSRPTESRQLIMRPLPFGGGSVAQVHSLLLPAHRNEKLYEELVLKVLRPFVRQKVRSDLKLLRLAARGIAAATPSSYFPVVESVDQFASMILPQTNLLTEAVSLKEFRSNFRSCKAKKLARRAGGRIILPRVIDTLSSREVLVETRERGIAFDQWLRKDKREGEAAQVAKLGANMFLKMLLIDNFVHADLHPGNMLIRINKRQRCWLRRCHWPLDLIVLDAGLTTKLTNEDRQNFVDLFKAVAFGEGWAAGKLILERSRRHACDDPDAFCTGVAHVVAKSVGPPVRGSPWHQMRQKMTVGEIRVGSALREILGLSMRHRVELDPAFVGVALAISILEGVGQTLDPELDMLAVARPFFGRIAVDQANLRWKKYRRFGMIL